MTPALTGSEPMTKTIGIVVVPALAARAGGMPPDVARTETLAANQIGRQRQQPIVLSIRPAVFDRHVLAFDEAGSH